MLKFIKIIIGIYIISVCISCDKNRYRGREEYKVTGQNEVLIYYACGYNDLRDYIAKDIEELTSNYLPTAVDGDNILLVYSHLSLNRHNSKTKTEPTLTRVYRDHKTKKIIKDTIRTFSNETISASAKTFNEVLSYIENIYPSSKHTYGLIFSSHATGWLPSGYYSNSSGYENSIARTIRHSLKEEGLTDPIPVPYVEPIFDPGSPLVKSIGVDKIDKLSYEMTIKEFAEAIPINLEYIIFDMCLMGGIEIAYELKDKCKYIVASQTEVLADGHDYTKIGENLLYSKANPLKVSKDFFEYYDSQTGVSRSATISLIDCSKIEDLALNCKNLFEKYRDNLGHIDYWEVQKYYRRNYHWFYDLKSVVDKLGANDNELALFNEALNKCIVYKAATDNFLDIKIESYSGLSMYLPCHGGSYLNNYYQDLKWNIDTELVPHTD